MAYNFMNHYHFDYDYNDLRRAVMISRIFDNKSLLECYCNYWIEKLKNAESSIGEEVFLDIEIAVNEDEIYTLGGMINRFQYFLFFNISKISEAYKHKQLEEHTILLHEVIENFQLGNLVDTDYYDSSKKDEPLIAIDLSYGDKVFTLIDGNHRLKNFLIPNGIEEVNFLFLTPSDKSIDLYFIDELSKVFYYFVKEWIMLMGSAKFLSDKEKIELTQLKNNEEIQEFFSCQNKKKWWNLFSK